MTDNFLVKGVAGLNTVDDFAFLVVALTRDHGNSLHVVGVEVLVLSVNLLNTKSLKGFYEFLVDEVHALFYGFGILVLVGESALKVVKYRQNGSDSLFATVEDKLSLLLESTLLIVVELGHLAQITVLEVVNLLLELAFFRCLVVGILLLSVLRRLFFLGLLLVGLSLRGVVSALSVSRILVGYVLLLFLLFVIYFVLFAHNVVFCFK